MKKGFTLIELLAVIVILAIILLIAVPQVLDVIEDVKNNAYISTNDLVVDATELYMASHIDKLPNEIGNTSIVELASDLQEKGFIEEVNAMDNTCSGYVAVTKVDDDNFSYDPYINCSSTTINTPNDDGLVLNYTFDDFQEPTENIYREGVFPYNNLSIPYTLSATGEFYNKSPVYRLTMTPTIQTQVDSINNNLYNHGVYSILYTYEGNTKYASSIYWKSVNKNDVVVNGLASNIGGWHNGGTEEFNDGWKRCNSYRDGTVASDMTGRIFWSFSSPSFTLGETIIIDWAAPQVEKYRIYSTSYTETSRTGTVKDYSANSNSVDLTLENTPKWVYDEERQNGVYYFYGDNDRIDIAASTSDIMSTTTQNWSYGAWVKSMDPDTSKRAVIGNYDGVGGDSNVGIWLLQMNGRWYTDLRGEAGLDYIDSGVNVTSEWTQLFVTVSNEAGTYTIKIFVNGELKNEGSVTAEHYYIDSGTLRIGATGYGDIQEYWRGYMDDVRIYERALSDIEVKNLYIATK